MGSIRITPIEYDHTMKTVLLTEDDYHTLIGYKRTTELLIKSADKLRDVFYDGQIFTSAISGFDVYELTMDDMVKDLTKFKNSFIYKLWITIKKITKW